MYKGRKVIALIPAHNEETKVGRVVERIDHALVDTVLVIDDASSDATVAAATAKGAEVISTCHRAGVGATLR
ncbi:MAG: glycosyltransferase, partial [Phycisphaerae bacterium]